MVFGIHRNENGLYIEGYPTAEKVVHVEFEQALELADLRAHQSDLKFAQEAVAFLIDRDRDTTNDVLARSAFIAAMVKYVGCFKASVRRPLVANDIYGQSEGALRVFEYFDNLRNKHVLHDVNNYTTSQTGLVVRPTSTEARVIDAFSIVSNFAIDEDHTRQLRQLIDFALAYVDGAAENKAQEVVGIGRLMSDGEIDALPNLQLKTGTAEDIKRRR